MTDALRGSEAGDLGRGFLSAPSSFATSMFVSDAERECSGEFGDEPLRRVAAAAEAAAAASLLTRVGEWDRCGRVAGGLRELSGCFERTGNDERRPTPFDGEADEAWVGVFRFRERGRTTGTPGARQTNTRRAPGAGHRYTCSRS